MKTTEGMRLEEDREQNVPWKKWGPYLGGRPRLPRAWRLLEAGLAVLLLAAIGLPLWGTHDARAATPDQAQSRPLRVVTKPIEPFVIQRGDQWIGFSIDLWDEIARRLKVSYEWVGVKSVGDQLKAVQNGDADVAIAGISMTSERELMVDFTHPYFDAGLQILAVPRAEPPYARVFHMFLSPALLQIALVGLLLAVVMGTGIWLVERRDNPNFPRGPIRGIWEGMWWLLSIVGNGEYRDKETSVAVKRFMTIACYLVGVALIAQFTGTVASSLTVETLQSSISGPSDLPGKEVAAVRGTTSAQYLRAQGVSFTEVAAIPEGYDLLARGRVQAVVYDSPVLRYYATHAGKGQVQVVGPIFKPEKYGIALPPGSALRKPINETLLGLYQDGTYETIYAKWFGE